MKNKLSLDELKKIELGIMDYIHELCERNDVKYSLSYGTLLGAIRHKGFIPWDDDIDIVMPRQDYNKFVKLIKEDDNPRFSFKSSEDDDYNYEFAKVVDNTTIVIEDECEGTNIGVWVDIFPLDGLHKDDKAQVFLLYFLERSRVASVYKHTPRCSIFVKPFMFVYWTICKMIGANWFLKKIANLSQKYKYEDCEFVGYAPTIHSINKFMSKEWFASLIDIQFEGRLYKATEKYDLYLKSLYGNYMQLPPEDKRLPHKIKAYYK